MRILIYGLSGAGKTTLANQLAATLAYPIINGDRLREMSDDWDFSIEGRLRQAVRARDMATNCIHSIIDLVCPLHEMRDILDPDVTILMDTIRSCQYEDTNKMFEKGAPMITIKTFDYNLQSVVDALKDLLDDIQNL
jgi:adenylylsulfate kinase